MPIYNPPPATEGGSNEMDGGSASAAYLTVQMIDGGGASG